MTCRIKNDAEVSITCGIKMMQKWVLSDLEMMQKWALWDVEMMQK